MKRGGIAQLVERLLCKQDVSGSSPLTSTKSRQKNLKHHQKKTENAENYFQPKNLENCIKKEKSLNLLENNQEKQKSDVIAGQATKG